MPEPDSVRDELMALLRYANRSDIARALKVTPQAVINWAEGRNTSPARLLQIRRLYRLPVTPEQQERAAPSMTRRLLAGVIALERRANISPDELASAQESAELLEAAMEADARAAAELEASRRKSGGRTGGLGGGRAAGSQGSTPRKP